MLFEPHCCYLSPHSCLLPISPLLPGPLKMVSHLPTQKSSCYFCASFENAELIIALPWLNFFIDTIVLRVKSNHFNIAQNSWSPLHLYGSLFSCLHHTLLSHYLEPPQRFPNTLGFPHGFENKDLSAEDDLCLSLLLCPDLETLPCLWRFMYSLNKYLATIYYMSRLIPDIRGTALNKTNTGIPPQPPRV